MLKPSRGTQVNWSNPLAKGLISCWLLNEGAGNKVFDLVQHQLSENTSNLPTWGVGAHGAVTRHNSSNRWNVTQAISKQKYCPASITIEMMIRQTANLAAQFDEYNLVSTQDTSSAQGYYLGLKQEASPPFVPRIVFQLNNGGFSGLNLDSVMTVGNWVHIVGSYITGNRRIYVNGISRANDTYSSGYGSTTIANGFNIGFGGGTTVVEVAYVRLWNRALQAGEITQLYAKPFEMFETSIIVITDTSQTINVNQADSVAIGSNLSTNQIQQINISDALAIGNDISITTTVNSSVNKSDATAIGNDLTTFTTINSTVNKSDALAIGYDISNGLSTNVDVNKSDALALGYNLTNSYIITINTANAVANSNLLNTYYLQSIGQALATAIGNDLNSYYSQPVNSGLAVALGYSITTQVGSVTKTVNLANATAVGKNINTTDFEIILSPERTYKPDFYNRKYIPNDDRIYRIKNYGTIN